MAEPIQNQIELNGDVLFQTGFISQRVLSNFEFNEPAVRIVLDSAHESLLQGYYSISLEGGFFASNFSRCLFDSIEKAGVRQEEINNLLYGKNQSGLSQLWVSSSLSLGMLFNSRIIGQRFAFLSMKHHDILDAGLQLETINSVDAQDFLGYYSVLVARESGELLNAVRRCDLRDISGEYIDLLHLMMRVAWCNKTSLNFISSIQQGYRHTAVEKPIDLDSVRNFKDELDDQFEYLKAKDWREENLTDEAGYRREFEKSLSKLFMIAGKNGLQFQKVYSSFIEKYLQNHSMLDGAYSNRISAILQMSKIN